MNPRQSPARSVEVETNSNVATNVRDSREDDVPDYDDDWDFEGAAVLDEVDRIGFKRRFRNLRESCCAKRQKVPDTAAEVVE